MNRTKITAIVLIVFVVAIVVILYFLKGTDTSVTPPPTPPVSITPQPTAPPEQYVPKDGKIEPYLPLEQQANYVVEITTAGFSPADLKIKKGDSVVWTNRDSSASHGVAAVDPKYPEKSDCGTKLDSCFNLKLGESFRSTFVAAGVWYYVDPTNPKFRGRLTVE